MLAESISEGIAIVVLIFWIALTLDLPRRWPGRRLKLDSRLASARPPGGSVVVAIPARDEADVLARTFGSVLAQEEDIASLVLVDDRSEDGTGALARELVRARGEDPDRPDSRIRVVDGEPAPEAWSGKLWALARAVKLALERAPASRWILLTDADIVHPPGSIRALVSLAEERDRDLVSVMVRLRTHRFWERLLIPAFVWFFQLMYPFRRVASDRSRVAAAAGGCLLIRRELFERMGGLEPIHDAVIDDISLARLARRHGGRLWLGLCDSMLSARGYETLEGIVRMVARTAFDELRYSYVLCGLTLLGLLVFFVSPPVGVFLALAADWPQVGLAASLAWALQTLLYFPAVRHHGVAARHALALPVASVFYGYMTARSAWNHARGRGARWKGRQIGRADGPVGAPGA